MQAKIVLGRDSYNVVFSTCEELVGRIKEMARERGWAKIKVFLDGDPVSPAAFCSKLHDGAVVTVAKYDVAGIEAPEEGVWLTEEPKEEQEEEPEEEVEEEEEEEQEEEEEEQGEEGEEKDFCGGEKPAVVIKIYRDGRVVIVPPK